MLLLLWMNSAPGSPCNFEEPSFLPACLSLFCVGWPAHLQFSSTLPLSQPLSLTSPGLSNIIPPNPGFFLEPIRLIYAAFTYRKCLESVWNSHHCPNTSMCPLHWPGGKAIHPEGSAESSSPVIWQSGLALSSTFPLRRSNSSLIPVQSHPRSSAVTVCPCAPYE